MYGGRTGAYRVLVTTPEGRRPLERPTHRPKNNIKMNLQKVGWRAWNGLIWLRIGIGSGFCECSNEPLGSIKCGEFPD